MNYDVAIIGGGPAGYNAAALAAKKGKKTILFEKNSLGGTCLNEGCIPTKALLYSANFYDHLQEAKKYGITIEGEVVADYKRIAQRKSKIVRKLVLGVKQKMDAAGVDVVNAFARLNGEVNGCVRIVADGQDYTATDVLVCSGSEVAIPPIPGLEQSEYWTSREALDAKELPASVLVIGGGVIGMEFVSVYTSLGVKVTVVEMMPQILGRMDSELSTALREEYEKRGVTFYLNTKVVGVRKGGLTIETREGETVELGGEQILLAAGRRAVSQDMGLETLGIEVSRGAIVVNEFMQSTHPHVYACGDVNARIMLAHAAYRMGEVAINHITGDTTDVMRYDAIPGVVYTHPEIASVGYTEEELKEKGIPYRILRLPMSYAGRFVVENETGNGFFKLLVSEDEKVLGGHFLGNPASEMVIVVGMAITEGMTLDQLRKQIFPHPTVSEIVREVLFE